MSETQSLGEVFWRASNGDMQDWHAGKVNRACWERMAAKVLDGRLTEADATLVYGSATDDVDNRRTFRSARRALQAHVLVASERERAIVEVKHLRELFKAGDLSSSDFSESIARLRQP